MSTRSERRRRREKQERALRIADTPEQQRITAYHESSHAVLAELCDFPVEYVTCLPEMLSRNHPMVAQARRMGAIPLRAGATKLVLTDGVVPVPFPERCFFYIVGQLASIPAEKRLGVPDREVAISCQGDIDRVQQAMDGNSPSDVKARMMLAATILASLFVSHTKVWGAIEQMAQLLLGRGRIEGEDVRQIVGNIPKSIFFSEDRQRDIWQEGGPPIAVMTALEEETEEREEK